MQMDGLYELIRASCLSVEPSKTRLNLKPCTYCVVTEQYLRGRREGGDLLSNPGSVSQR